MTARRPAPLRFHCRILYVLLSCFLATEHVSRAQQRTDSLLTSKQEKHYSRTLLWTTRRKCCSSTRTVKCATDKLLATQPTLGRGRRLGRATRLLYPVQKERCRDGLEEINKCGLRIFLCYSTNSSTTLYSSLFC